MRPVLRAALGALLVLAVLAPAGGLAAAPATRVVFVAPVDRNGRPNPSDVITETVTGSCEPGSDVVTGPVYRCGADPGPADRAGGIVDPCMAAVYGHRPTKTVLCILAPWSHHVVRIVTKGLPKSPDSFSRSLAFPFGVRLSAGAQCPAAQGAHDQFRGRTVNYFCTRRPALVLLGAFRESREPWTVDSAAQTASGYRAAPAVSVAVAWFLGWAPGT